MFEIDFEDIQNTEDIILEDIQNKEEPKKLLNRNYIYLQLLDKRLKKFEFLEKHNIKKECFSSSDNSYLDEQDYSNIEHSENFILHDGINKKETIILKQLLEKNLEYSEIFSSHLEKHICLDQEIYESHKKIKLRYLGFKKDYQIYENLQNYDFNKNYHNYIYCLDTGVSGWLYLCRRIIYVFEVLEDNFDKKYIFFSAFSRRFYKTNEYIKLNYLVNNNFEFQLQITKKHNNFEFIIGYKFEITDLDNNNIDDNKFFRIHRYMNYYILVQCRVRRDEFLEIHTKNIHIKGINKN